MSGHLKHRPLSSSRSLSSTSSTARGNYRLPSTNQHTNIQKKTRSRTDSGERLPEEDRPTIKAFGEHWEVHPYESSRKPPIVIGALVHEMYPDIVQTINGIEPVLTWGDYKRTSTNGITNNGRIVAEFWWHFKCRPEDKDKADEVLELKFKNIVPKMLSEEKQAVIKKLYKDGNVPLEDVDEEGNRWPTREALISAKPKDFTTDEGWALLCEHWCKPEFRKVSFQARRNRLTRGNETHHRGGSRSLPATRQFLALKTGVDPGLAGAWLHNHELHKGTNDGMLCNQSGADKWAQYEEGMEKKYGLNWKDVHPQLDAAVIYECVGRMPHGKLGVADGAISIAKKEAIKTRKRCAQPHSTAREKRLERENENLRKENNALRELQRVVRAMAAKGGMDYDALVLETTTNLATSESEVGFTKEHDNVGQNEAEKGNNTDASEYNREDEDDYNNGGEDYDGEGDEDYGNYDGEDYGYEDNGNYGGEDYGYDRDYDLW